MRLDFNLVVVDDDWNEPDKSLNVRRLVDQIKTKVESKGFILNEYAFTKAEDAQTDANRRVDLFLSDNNLGDSKAPIDPNKKNGGVAFYLQLRQMHSQSYLCDFVLYTRSTYNDIVNMLSEELNSKQDPNLFSRFTFVSRNAGGDGWHQPILTLIDHILTKREELNTLRAIYAQYISRIELRLKDKFGISKRKNLEATIIAIPPNASINKNLLHELRLIRNGLMHNDEKFCPTTQQYVIAYKQLDGTPGEIRENELQIFRTKLNTTYETVMAI